jgi:glutamate formiminotransferase
MEPIVECVPNFSEGRDVGIVCAINQAIGSVAGVRVLDQTMDADHHRSVITFAGSPGAVVEAAVRGAAKAVETIDLNLHRGVHPRLGAVDVIPFVPIRGITMAECAAMAVRAGGEIWKRLALPVYLYGEGRRKLEDVRRGQFEGLRNSVLVDESARPDFGGPELHPTAGAAIVGARKVLIAFNVNLNTDDVRIANAIARTIRTSGGGFPNVKAIGLLLQSRRLAQVSMNLTDYEVTPPHVVFQAIGRQAAEYGVSVAGSEIIGLIPRQALETEGVNLRIENYRPEMVLEYRLEQTLK